MEKTIAQKCKDLTSSVDLNQFEVVPEASDHHFLTNRDAEKAKKCLQDVSILAKIMQEWKIIRKNLPDSIYVQVYENQINLLRALIVGPSGTPYHNGLFFFDIMLPCDYPNHPPKVYYHSHGYRLNPNLYANGKLCLSLINTWLGKKDEKWTKKSTILQLLVSIQGLVLNRRPYFNEPGYEVGRDNPSPKWINPSVAYNANAFMLSCRTMMMIIQKPPEHFEIFVLRHFLMQRDPILAAVRTCPRDCVEQVGAASKSCVPSYLESSLRRIYHDLDMALAFLVSEDSLRKLAMMVKKKKRLDGTETGAKNGEDSSDSSEEDEDSGSDSSLNAEKSPKKGLWSLLGSLVMCKWE